MNDKLLFWLDEDFVFYNLAYSLQSKYPSEFYAIINEEQIGAKIFFQNQKFVNFKNTWYYHENVKTEKREPDLAYLSKFEEKYGIDIWGVAYTDRYFYKEFNPYYKFDYKEILSMIEQECKFFERVLDSVKPDFLLIHAATNHNTYLIYQLCKSRKIKVLALESARFTNQYMITEEVLKHDKLINPPDLDFKNKNTESINNEDSKLNKFDNQIIIRTNISRWRKLKAIIEFFSSRNDIHKERYHTMGRTKMKILLNGTTKIRAIKRRRRESFINKNFMREVPNDTKFVYYPMQSEPERVTFIGSPFYTNQIAIITNIAKSLPVGYQLFVKEHPIMKQFDWRPISYYKQILDLPNVKMIHPSITPENIMKKCSLVITIVGSSTLEATFHAKPSIIFMNSDYSILPSVHTLTNITELPNAIRLSLQKTVNPLDLKKYQVFIHSNSFYFDKIKFVKDFSNAFHYIGYMKKVDFPIPQVNDFLENHKEMFDSLADEYIAKIKHHKEYDSLKHSKQN